MTVSCHERPVGSRGNQLDKPPHCHYIINDILEENVYLARQYKASAASIYAEHMAIPRVT